MNQLENQKTPIQAIDEYLDKVCPIDKEAMALKRNLRRDYIVRTICKYYGVPFEELNQLKRYSDVTLIRHTINYILRERIAGLSYQKIGEMWTYGYFHRKGVRKEHQDHGNILSSVNTYRDLLWSDKRIKKAYDEINQIIDSGVESGVISFDNIKPYYKPVTLNNYDLHPQS